MRQSRFTEKFSLFSDVGMSFFDFHVPLKYRVQTIAVASPQPMLVDTAIARKPMFGAKISVTANRVTIDVAE